MTFYDYEFIKTQRWSSRAANRANMPFPDVLRRLRESHDLSQSKLAAKVGIDHSTASRLEMGTRNPSPSTLAVLADEFDLKGEERFQFFASAGRFEDIPSNAQVRLMAAIAELDGDELGAVQAILAWQMTRQKPHSYAANDGHLWYSQDTQLERPGGASNTPDPATKE